MMPITLESIFIPHPEVATQEIEGEFLIIPLSYRIGGKKSELLSLNETGIEIWKRLDGKRSLQTITRELAEEYTATLSEIEADVLDLITKLAHRNFLVELKNNTDR